MKASVGPPVSEIRVVVIEDVPKMREGLRIVLQGTPGYTCAGAFGDAETALRELPQLKPDVVLMDINLPGMSGIKCAKIVKDKLPDAQIVMVTVHEDDEAIFDALEAGASGYLLKRASPLEILQAISDVHAGGSPMSSTIARKVIQSFHERGRSHVAAENLTQRESEILNLLAKGYLYKEIADQLKISYSTVHTHVGNIYHKLHVRSRTEAVAKYLGRDGDQRDREETL